MTNSRIGGCFAALAALLASLIVTTPAQAAPRSPALAWGDCPSPAEGRSEAQECAELRVPLDYRHPNGRTITLTVSRLATSVPDLRRGILVVNPGGPASPALDMPSELAEVLPREVLDRYDLVSFDPRGLRYSTPITCGLPEIPDPWLPWPAPDGSIDGNAAEAKRIATSCWRHAGDMLPHISTENVARDIDRVRGALGEPTISYLGVSWGTALGAIYATLFPHRTDRIVLDSAYDPSDGRSLFDLLGYGMEARFGDFAAFVAAREETYQLGGTPAEVRERYFQIADRLDEEPFPYPGGGGLLITGNLFRDVTRSAFYDDVNFPALAEFWQLIDQGTGEPTLAAAVAEPGIADDNQVAAGFGITCGDSRPHRDLRRYEREVRADRERWPLTNGMPANVFACAYWRGPAPEPIQIRPAGPVKVLIVQSLRDPGTPYPGALSLLEAFGDRARMLALDAGQHGVFTWADECSDGLASAFLAGGELPATNLLCTPAAGGGPGALTPGLPPSQLG